MQTAVNDRLTAIAACLCAQIETDGLPPVCFCGVVPGDQVALDYVGDNCATACGMAWVRLIGMYPSVSLGQPNTEPGNCQSLLGLEVEVGIMRCASLPDDDGTPPSAADLAGDVELQAADALTMRRALLCCASSQDLMLGPYTPQGPEGGLVGGVWGAALLEL